MAYNSIDRIPRDSKPFWLADHTSMHRNLIDNPFFTVNSRNIDSTGVSDSSGNNTFCFDRWKFVRGTAKAITGGCNYSTTSSGQYKRFFQSIKAKPAVDDELTVTLHGKINAISGNWYVTLFGSASGANYQLLNIVKVPTGLGEFWLEDTFNVPADGFSASVPTGIGLYANGTSCTIDIDLYAIKLERGNYSTLKMDYPPDYYTEYIKCITSTVDPNDSYANNSLIPKTGGTMSGDIAMGSNKITGLGTPTADGDAATKKYVDDRSVTSVDDNYDAYASYPRKTVSGNIASFTDGEYRIPVKDCSIAIMSTQSGSGEPTVNNVRPIVGGWTAANIITAGKNVLPNKAESSGTTAEGLSWTKDSDGVITVNGTASANSNIYICKFDSSSSEYYPLASKLKNGNYILSGCPSGGGSSTYRLILSRNNGTEYFTDTGSGISFTKTDTFSTISVYLRFNSGVTATNLKFYPMLRPSSFTDSTYEKYNGTEIDISFPSEAGIVYGGILDATNGILTVTKAKVALGSLIWTRSDVTNNSGNYYYYSSGISNLIQWLGAASSTPDIICSDYTPVSSNTLYNNGTRGYPNGDVISVTAASAGDKGYIWVLDSRHMNGDLTGAGFKAILETSGAEMVYSLATPITYLFSPVEIKTLYANNNIWTDCGDVTVDYHANPDLYMTASSAITSGKYFMIGDTLYLSTTSIAAGAKIIVGTNCNMVNLADALNAINA